MQVQPSALHSNIHRIRVEMAGSCRAHSSIPVGFRISPLQVIETPLPQGPRVRGLVLRGDEATAPGPSEVIEIADLFIVH
jgi:hypothetical protein